MRHQRWLVIREQLQRPKTIFLLLATIGLVTGVAVWLAGADSAASALWAATAVGGSVPLAVSVMAGLLRREGRVDLIALLAIAGSLLLGEYLAGAVISVMLASGWALEDYAKGRSTRDLSVLLERVPRVVHRYEGADVMPRPLSAVQPGDLLLVKPGTIVPVDGMLASSRAVLDESALTGEAGLVEHVEGDQLRSGGVNGAGAFDLRATTSSEESTYAGIVRLVREAQASKAPLVRLADRYALAFVPATLLLAGAGWVISGDPVRALAVLVVATPCPLILAAPIAIVSGISRAARRGIIMKGGGALEALSRGRVLLLDKTGTITAGRPVVTELEAPGFHDSTELLRLAASLDQLSTHVLGAAIVRAARERRLPLSFPNEVIEEPGQGIRGLVEGVAVSIGRAEWVSTARPLPEWARKLRRRAALEGRNNVFVAVGDTLSGALILDDPIRPDSSRTIRALRRAGIERIVLVTGDHADVAQTVGAAVGVDEVLAERTPADKVDAVGIEQTHGSTVMVGDGINDAPALAAADVGVALGARGASASSEAADAVLVVDRLDRLSEGLQIARRARTIALQSVLLGMALSLGAMAAATGGALTPVAGAFLQEAIDVVAILNALRALGGYKVSAPMASHQIALTQRFQAEHATLLPIVTQLRTVADQLGRVDSGRALVLLKHIYDLLVESLLPHEAAEEGKLYPMMADILGGEDPTGTMSRSHVEISHLVRALAGLIEDIRPTGPSEDDVPELQRVLYGLYAILRLHFAQEEEAYLSLAEAKPETGRDTPVVP